MTIFHKSGMLYIGMRQRNKMSDIISGESKLLLKASFLPGVGVVAQRKIISHVLSYGFDILYDESAILEKFSVGSRVSKKSGSFADDVISSCLSQDIQVISPFDDYYPKSLLKIKDYPPLLYVKGNLHNLNRLGFAVVGTREPSKLGVSWARQIAEIFAQYGYVVTSGLALGIDTAAHQGALRGGGVTVAVLAHGLDKITPTKNKELAKEILASNGALVSEHPPGTPPRKQEYVRRNRLQSGMSVCSVIIESGDKGGTIHQGRFTDEQGRILMCVMPDESTQGYQEFRVEGGNKLLSEYGGVKLSSRAQLIEMLEGTRFECSYNELVSSDGCSSAGLL